MLPLVAMYENQVIPKGIKINYFAPTKKHISSIKQEKPSKVINNQHNFQTQTKKLCILHVQIIIMKSSYAFATLLAALVTILVLGLGNLLPLPL